MTRSLIRPTSVFGLSLACVAAATACGGSNDTRPVAGHIPVWTVHPTPALSIGALDGGPAYIFSNVEAVRLLPDDDVVVADRSSGTLRAFNAAGRFVRQMGGLGKGPGEFSWLGEMFIRPPDTIVAYDPDLFRMTRYLAAGDLVSTLTLQVPDGYPDIYIGRYSDGSYGVAWIKQVPFDRDRWSADLMRMARLGEDGSSTVLLGEQPGMRRLGSPLPLSPAFMAVMVGDTIFHSDGVGGLVIGTRRGGDTIRSFHVASNRVFAEQAIRDLETALDSASVQRLVQLNRRVDLDTVPTLSDMLVDSQGRLWLKRYAAATDSHWVLRLRTGGEWLVVQSDGTPVARVAVPKGFRLMEVRDGLLAGVMHDDLGVERVQIYTLDDSL